MQGWASRRREAGERAPGPAWRAVPASALPALVALLCIGAHAGLLGLGRWQSDELTLLINQRNWGWEVLPHRLSYAPRPFSEGLLFLYGEAVLAAGRPLIVPFLGTLWAGTFGMAWLAARGALPPSRLRTSSALALAAAPFAFVLATNDVTEMFYWPAAAAAYLPTAGAATVLLFALSRPLDRWRRLACGAALLVAAGSSEMGAALAVSFAGAAALASGLGGRLRPAVRGGAWWAVPGLAGVAVLALVASRRAGLVELGSDAQPYTGQAAAAIGLGLRQLALDLAGEAGAATPLAALGALTAKLLFALGFALAWRQADPAGAEAGRWQAALAASLAGASFFSAATAYYHYGTLCCERQATARSWMMNLAVILAAGWAAARWKLTASRATWLPAAMLAASLSPVLLRLDGLRTDYGNQRLAADAIARTWRSGRSPGDAMEFYLPPDGPGTLVRGTGLPLSTFQVAGPGVPVLVTEMGRFFGKSLVATCQPWQNERAWIIRGEFIPACPPNDGPPQVVP